MKISELIEQLKQIQEEYGDLKVVASIPYSPSVSNPSLEVRKGQLEICGDE